MSVPALGSLHSPTVSQPQWKVTERDVFIPTLPLRKAKAQRGARGSLGTLTAESGPQGSCSSASGDTTHLTREMPRLALSGLVPAQQWPG